MSDHHSAGASTALRSNELGTGGIVFLVLAAVAPLTGIIVVTSIAIAVGNGGGMPGSFVLATLVLLLFAIGYAAMSRHIVSAGGFYAYVVKGLGRPMGLAAGFIAMLGYNGFVAGAIGTSGFFTGIIIAQLTGLDLPWIVWSLISVVLVFLLTRAGIAFSAKVLGVCLIAEITILLVLDVAILFRTGYSFQAFAPSSVFTPTIGLGLLFAGTCFLGFEATGLFSEEAKDPRRTIPRAIYIAILFIGAFATVTSWAIVSALGVATAQDAAVEHLSTGDLVFMLSQRYLGTALTDVMMVLLLVSLFAALLALHNAAARYIYAYGRVGILPGWLGRTHGRTGAPHTASFAQLVFGTAVALVFFALGLDPILLLVPAMTGFGTLAIIMLQLLAAVAVVAYFRRLKDRHLLTTFVAPALGALGLALIVTLAFINFPTMAGSDNPVIGALPWLIPVALVGGLVFAAWLRRRRPALYDALEVDIERYDEVDSAREIALEDAEVAFGVDPHDTPHHTPTHSDHAHTRETHTVDKEETR